MFCLALVWCVSTLMGLHSPALLCSVLVVLGKSCLRTAVVAALAWAHFHLLCVSIWLSCGAPTTTLWLCWPKEPCCA